MERLLRWLPLILGLGAFIFFASQRAPSLTWESSSLLHGSLIWGPETPFAPLYLLLVKIMGIFSWSEIPSRIHGLSALFSGISVGLIATIPALIKSHLKEYDDNIHPVKYPSLIVRLTGVGAAMLFFFSITTQKGAIEANLVAPVTTIILLQFIFFIRVLDHGRWQYGLALVSLYAFGAGLHPATLFSAPIFCFFLLKRIRQGAKWPLFAPLLFVSLYGSLILFHAIIATPNANSFTASFVHFWEPPAHSIFPVIEILGDNLILAIIAATGGIFWLSKTARRRYLAVFLLLPVIGSFAYSSVPLYQGMIITAIISILCSFSILWLATKWGKTGKYVALSCNGIILIGTIFHTASIKKHSHNLDAHTYASRVLEQCGKGAILIPSSRNRGLFLFVRDIERQHLDIRFENEVTDQKSPICIESVLAPGELLLVPLGTVSLLHQKGDPPVTSKQVQKATSELWDIFNKSENNSSLHIWALALDHLSKVADTWGIECKTLKGHMQLLKKKQSQKNH